MPNWIHTTIEITGKKETLEMIHSVINECLDMPPILADGSSNEWVGNIFAKLRINTQANNFRAFWTSAKFNKKGHLLITEESAWRRSKSAEALKDKFRYEISGINLHMEE